MKVTPDAMQGRVGSVAGLMASGANSAGALLGGFLLGGLSTFATVAGVSAVMLAVAVVAAVSPAIRSARHNPEAGHDQVD
jgi:hypothetical protein